MLDDGTIKVGSKPDPSSIAVWWLPEDRAIGVSLTGPA
jgi:hypothetical protein